MCGQPRATSATSALTVCITSGAAALQFLILGLLIVDWAVWYACLGLAATAFGLVVVNTAVKRSGRSSLIVICIAAIIIIACIMMVTTGIMDIVDAANKGKSFGFKDVC